MEGKKNKTKIDNKSYDRMRLLLIFAVINELLFLVCVLKLVVVLK